MMKIEELTLEKYPVRFSSHKKKSFLLELDEVFQEEGYPVVMDEKRSFRGKTRNRMYAYEKTAKLYIAVPYDTPQRLFWYKSEYYPLDGNRSLNKSMLATYVPALVLYGLILLFILFVSPNMQDLVLKAAANLAVAAATIFLMWLLFHGIGNRKNANRNSSSIIAAVRFMKTLNNDQKRRIGFVFIDRCDQSCLGAKLLSAYFADKKKNPDIIWLDCVGVGDTIGIGYRTHGKRLASTIHAKKKQESVQLSEMGGDQCLRSVMSCFDKAVMISAGEIDAKGSLLVKDTQRSTDRVIDDKNIEKILALLQEAIPRK